MSSMIIYRSKVLFLRKKYSSMTLLLFLLCLFQTSIFGAATFTSGSNATTLAQRIQGDGLIITNPTIWRHNANQAGIFSNGIAGANLRIDEGIVLTTGNVAQAFATNSAASNSVTYGLTRAANRDSDLQGILGGFNPYDTIVFEFDVTLEANTRLLLIEYQFASEEYPEYVGTVFNDAFGFFISGGDLTQTYNIARVVDNNTNITTENIQSFPAVSVNTVNGGVRGSQYSLPRDAGVNFLANNTAYYLNNNQNNTGGTSPITIQYDGITVLLQAAVDNLTPGVTYHFKLALADASDANLDSAVYVKRIQGIRVPDLCYDYGYQQNNTPLTHFSQGSPTPKIKGFVIPEDNINVSFYIQNEESSEVLAENISIDIVDINTTQLDYVANSVAIINPNQTTPTPILDTALTVDATSIQGIPLADLSKKERAYVYYSLKPKTANLDTDLFLTINYDITFNLGGGASRTVSYSSLLGEDIPMCAGDITQYEPEWGLFNVSSKGIYNSTHTHPKFNIPTQVAKRPGGFLVTSHDSNDPNFVNENPSSAIVGIEMIDAGKYHSTAASCQEPGSAITERFWTIFENSASIDFNTALNQAISSNAIATPSAESYFGTARQNAAFRVTFNSTGEGANEIIQAEKLANGKYRILNFPQLVQDIGTCKKPVRIHPYGHNNTNTTNQVSVACGNVENSGIDLFEFSRCNECITGYSTHYVCSRDNFSIRPESFNVRISDINQTFPLDIAQHMKFATDRTGVLPANLNTSTVHIAAGYQYLFDINATTHAGNDATAGYTRYFNEDTPSDYNISLIWSPKTTVDCNNTVSQPLSFYFVNGTTSTSALSEDIGEYTLSAIDESWTAVDGDLSRMSHHKNAYVHNAFQNVSNYFVGNGNALDCLVNSSLVQQATTLPGISGSSLSNINGCIISSDHNNTSANLSYRNYDLRVHPFRFILNLTPSTGIDANVDFTNAWLYTNRLDDNATITHSLRLEGLIGAQGFNGINLRNFTNGCYAQDLTANLSHTLTTAQDPAQDLRYRFSDDKRSTYTPDISLPSEELNQAAPSFDISASSFSKGDASKEDGQMHFHFYSNFDRNISVATEPIRVLINDLNATCKDASDCTMQANLTPSYQTNGALDINSTIRFYYGRVHAPDYRGVSPIDARIGYEVYCRDCNRTAFGIGGPSSPSSNHWFINTNHTTITQGVSKDKNASSIGGTTDFNKNPTQAGQIVNGVEQLVLTTTTLPSVDRIEITPSPWLVFNPFVDTNTTDFIVEFTSEGKWAGEGSVRDDSDIVGVHSHVTDGNSTIKRNNQRINW